MEHTPYLKFTQTRLNPGAPQEAREAYYSDFERFIIRCEDEPRRGELGIKFEEYSLRAQRSPNPRVVRDAICKMAILYSLLKTDDRIANYIDVFDWAKSGIEAYGGDILIESESEADVFLVEFNSAFETIRSYVETGNEFVEGGTQLMNASDF